MIKTHHFFKSFLVVLISSIAVQKAIASQDKTPSDQIVNKIAALQKEYGDEGFGGAFYRSEDDKIVLNVPNNIPMPDSLSPKIEVRPVQYTLQELQAAQDEVVGEITRKKLTSTYKSSILVAVDIKANNVQVKVEPKAPTALINEINALIRDQGDKVTVGKRIFFIVFKAVVLAKYCKAL